MTHIYACISTYIRVLVEDNRGFQPAKKASRMGAHIFQAARAGVHVRA